ncbi:MAG: insulinase family protein, partial [Planctomycetaceae bacterium]
PGVVFYLCQASKGSNERPILEAMLETLEDFENSPVTKEEVERAKQEFLAARDRAFANTSQFAIQLSEWAAQGDWRLYFLYRDRMEKVTAEQVQEVAVKYLTRNNRTAGLFSPSETAERIAIPPTGDVAKMLDGYKGRAVVSKGEVFDPALANVEKRTERSQLPSGIKVALLPKETRGDTVSLRLTLRYGDKDTLNGREKAGEFLPSMLMRGTENMSRQQVKDAFAKLGSQVQIVGQASVVLVTVNTKRDKLAETLDLLRTVLREPDFADKEVETLKTEQIAGFEQMKSMPQGLAQTAITRKMSPYKKGDPRYQATIEEEIERTKKITSSDIRNLYEDLMNGQNGELTIVGDFDAATAIEKVKAIVSDWESDTKYVRLARLGNFDLEGDLETIETPDKANAMFIAGTSFPVGMDNSEYPALVIANQLLGGNPFTSRLGMRLRQKDGLSYAVGSQLQTSPYDKTTSLLLFAISAPQNGEKLRTAVKEEIDRMRADGVTQKEVDQAVKGYLQQQQNRRTTDAALAGLLEQTTRTGRGLKFTSDIEAKIKGLKKADVDAVIKKYIDHGKLSVVHAGDFEKK